MGGLERGGRVEGTGGGDRTHLGFVGVDWGETGCELRVRVGAGVTENLLD